MNYSLNLPFHHSGDTCPACSAERDKGGRLVLKRSRTYDKNNGNVRYFLSCSRYPDCQMSVSATRTMDNREINSRLKQESLSCSCPTRYAVSGKSGRVILRINHPGKRKHKLVKNHKPTCVHYRSTARLKKGKATKF